MHFRERDLFPGNDWHVLSVRERNRTSHEPFEHIDREVRDSWSLDRDREHILQTWDQRRKRRGPVDVRPTDCSPSNDRSRKRRCISPDRSPGNSSRDGGRHSDSDRDAKNERYSPSRDRRNSTEKVSCGKHEAKATSLLEKEKDRKHRTIECVSPLRSKSKSDLNAKASDNFQEHDRKLNVAWHGMLVLKNSSFSTNMHFLEGDLSVATNLLVDVSTGGKVAQLKITQRLRLDQPKLDEVTRRIKASGTNGYCVLLAVPALNSMENVEGMSSGLEQATSPQRPLRNLVSYLKQKQAAGVISLPVGGSKEKDHTGVLHAFPPCDFSQQYLQTSARALAKSEEDCLVIIIVRGAA